MALCCLNNYLLAWFALLRVHIASFGSGHVKCLQVSMRRLLLRLNPVLFLRLVVLLTFAYVTLGYAHFSVSYAFRWRYIDDVVYERIRVSFRSESAQRVVQFGFCSIVPLVHSCL